MDFDGDYDDYDENYNDNCNDDDAHNDKEDNNDVNIVVEYDDNVAAIGDAAYADYGDETEEHEDVDELSLSKELTEQFIHPFI
ncbi:hypothetical protein DPMN_125792 [Dreissena polymorpha]|uniref:Uncharacterized protein n=1 Tax=Dreissena polymorpha TaxID=45954 RepID=A0A9D4H235_DREPO|nr:hypothetical protein DPMN_125792 [Dreissena polymorpha]